MTKTIAFVLIIALRLVYQPVKANKNFVPFTSRQPVAATANPAHARFMGISAIKINNNIILKWIIGENENAWCFEVEKSADGKKFSLTALVFGTDKTGADSYWFSEKAGRRRLIYRIKYIGKDNTTEYSPVTTISPNI
jgi:hypothetical protein